MSYWCKVDVNNNKLRVVHNAMFVCLGARVVLVRIVVVHSNGMAKLYQ